jgi:eukaryotic-like serine/threonine-protein kinase
VSRQNACACLAKMHEIIGYEVLATLGKGARSTIYAVKDKKNNIYALKQVIKTGPEDQRFVDQAVLEHQIARKLDHPKIRQSFKLIRHRKVLRTSEVYVLMEMVDGVTLEEYEFRDMADLCEIMQKVAEGLQAFHDAGYVHADLKPNNIMADEKQVVKIIDFGQSCPTNTVKPRIQGTPDYIAPEQVKRQQITPRTDVFNLGATMYWLTTRKHIPTMLASKGEAGSLRNADPKPKTVLPPAELNPDVPPALSSLIMSCVQDDPAERPSSMKQVQDRLGMALSQLSRSASAGSARSASAS